MATRGGCHMSLNSIDGSAAAHATLFEPAYYPGFPVGPAPRTKKKLRRLRRAELHEVFARKATRGLMSPSCLRTGYVPTNPLLDLALNRGFAALCLIASLPIMLTIAIAALARSDQRILVRETRVGKDGYPFDLLWFGSVCGGASQVPAQTGQPSELPGRFDRYLCDTGLDALPQLFNILKGDMVFFGPQPLTPTQINSPTAEDSRTARQMSLTPGFVSLSKILLPSCANVQFEGRIDTMACRAPVRYALALSLVSRSGLAVLGRCLRPVNLAFTKLRAMATTCVPLRSDFATPAHTSICISTDCGNAGAQVVGLSNTAIQFVAELPPEPGVKDLTVFRTLATNRTIQMNLRADVKAAYPLGPGKSGFVCYATYTAPNRHMRYRIGRYLLGETLLVI
jgi:lipopolysaccharide/colanic/teichoic acid biosynthesis glycosyltransferase